MSSQRGRPKSGDDTPILEYTQIFKEHTGEKFVWKWDKVKFPNGPTSVEIFSNEYHISEKLLKDIDVIETKYIQKPGQRKPRITKEDNKKLDELKNQLENEHYRLFPEDDRRKPIPKTKNNKNPKKKI